MDPSARICRDPRGHIRVSAMMARMDSRDREMAERNLRVLELLEAALERRDEVFEIVDSSEDPDEAQERIRELFGIREPGSVRQSSTSRCHGGLAVAARGLPTRPRNSAANATPISSSLTTRAAQYEACTSGRGHAVRLMPPSSTRALHAAYREPQLYGSAAKG